MRRWQLFTLLICFLVGPTDGEWRFWRRRDLQSQQPIAESQNAPLPSADGTADTSHKAETSSERTDADWQLYLMLTATLIVISAGIISVALPLWRDVTQGLAKAKAERVSREEEDMTLADAWLKRKNASNAWMQQQEFRLAAEAAGDNSTGCWGCGAIGAGFKACSKCVEEQLASPCLFCSPSCMKDAWPRHKQWHAARQQQQQDAAERKAIETALRAVEQGGERISVPAKRPTINKRSKAGEGQQQQQTSSAGAGGGGAAECTTVAESDTAAYNNQLDRAEQQQEARERVQLANAFAHLTEQLERDNTGALDAKREDFGKLVAQIECLMETRHTSAQVDALFESSQSGGRVDLRAFLQQPSTLDWFLASEPVRPESQARKAGDEDLD